MHLCTYVHQNKFAQLCGSANSFSLQYVCLGCVKTKSEVCKSLSSHAPQGLDGFGSACEVAPGN